jgi:hypothetical protein
VSAGRDASQAHVDTVQWDYSTQVSTFSSRSGLLNMLSQMLEEHTTLLGLQEMDREVREAIQAVELEHALYPPDGHDLSVELDKAHASVNRMVYDRNTEAEQLSRQVVQVANILVDLGLLPIEDIPQLLNTTQ